MCSCFIIERRLCCARVGNDVMSRCCLHVTRFMLLGFCLHHKIIKHIFFHWWRWFYDWKTSSSSSLFLGNLWWKFDDTCRCMMNKNWRTSCFFVYTLRDEKDQAEGENCMSHRRHALLCFRLAVSGFLSLSPKHKQFLSARWIVSLCTLESARYR